MAADMRIPRKLSGTLASDGKVVTWDAERRRAVWGAPGEDEGGFTLPDTLPEIPATATTQAITDALVELGLVTQAEA